MSDKFIICVIFFNLFNLYCCFSQYYDLGQDPAGIKWQQINTENFQIIFPEEFSGQAQHLSNSLEQVYTYASNSLGHQPKKVSVIIHNQSSTSNAVVLWAPKRIEFYTTPSQNTYPQPWLDQLALHEFRHVVQIDKLNQGITKLLYYLLGEQATAAVLGLFVPLWFLEGDAVATETALSNAGRGRIPGFEMELRSQVLERKIYSYDKAVFGSYKDYIPNHYRLGYHIIANARKKYGAAIWDDFISNVARFSFPHIKKHYDITKTKLYKETFIELDSLWKKQMNELSYTKNKTINKRESITQSTEPRKQAGPYTNYRFPQYLVDGSIVADKSGIGDINQFIMIDEYGNEKRIFTPGFYTPVTLSVENNILVWAERTYDPRWENRDYSVIKRYDIYKKKLKTLTHKTRLFAPSLSPDAARIAAVNVSSTNDYELVILDAATGEVLKQIKTPGNDFILTPTWSDDGKNIVTILLNDKGKSLAIVDVESGGFETLLPYSFDDISKPVMHGNHIFFNAIYSGIGNIYAIDLDTKQVYQVTSSKFGAYDACVSPDGIHLAYSDYTSSGYDVVETELNPEDWRPLEDVENNSIQLYKHLVDQEVGQISSGSIFDSLPDKQYETRKYRKWQHLFNFHSWAPLSVNVNNYNVNPGISILSQNKLSTTFTTLGYEYNYLEKFGEYFINFSYRGWYPILDFSISYAPFPATSNFSFYDASIGLRLPLNLNKGKYTQGMSAGVNTDWLVYQLPKLPANSFYPIFCDSLFPSSDTTLFPLLHYMYYNFFAYRQTKTSSRDLEPRWGQQISANYIHTPFESFTNAATYSIKASLFFPGIIKHHSLKVNGGYQVRIGSVGKGNCFPFNNLINYPRGVFLDDPKDYLVKYGDTLYTFSIDYKLPLLYPDLSISSLVYIKRLKANLFYDYAIGTMTSYSKIYQSTGIELTADMHIFRLLFPFDLGVRYIYLPDLKKSKFEFMFSIDFAGI